MRICPRFYAALISLLLAGPLRAESLEIITLHHKTADAVLPMVRPFLDPGGTASGSGNKLFVRTSETNLGEIRRLLNELDRATKTLRVIVSRDRQQVMRDNELNARANISFGHNVRILSGTPARGDSRLEIGTARGSLGIAGSDGETQSLRAGEQSVQVQEGERAFVQVGTSVPVPVQQVIPGPGGAIVTRATTYRDLGQGFYVRPTLSDNRVSVEISQEDSTPGRYGAGSAEISRLSTTVHGRLGEWISLGGIDQQQEITAGGGWSRSTHEVSTRSGVWLKVEDVAN